MQQKVNRILAMSVGVIVVLSAITGFNYQQSSQDTMNRAPFKFKTYSVSLSIDDWRNVLQAQDSSRRILIRTKLPTDETNYCIQTSFALSQQISTQVGEQLAEEQKAAAKKDSIDKAKPKNK